MGAKAVKWNKKMDAMLGTAPDPEIAAALKIGAESVFKRRKKLGVGAYGHRCKLDEFPMIRTKLGKVPDSEIAKIMGVTKSSVAYYRKVRNIKPARRGNV